MLCAGLFFHIIAQQILYITNHYVCRHFFKKLKPMNFKKLNNISGWIICAIACAVYILTAEKAGSLWDCGEFVSCAYKLQLPHPPGAPLFVLLGRFFIILFGDNPNTAAHAVNIMSAVASGFTILFLFWTITHFARKIAGLKTIDNVNSTQAWAIMGSGVVGALAYTFSDSFWFSAVEGEVYALSSFFTGIVFWAILKWEQAMDEETTTSSHPDRWIVFIFFMMGLSIGVHLLNLLCIPAIVMVYYLRKQHTFNYKVIRKWFLILTAVGGVLGMIGAYMMHSQENAQLAKYESGIRNAFGDVEIADTTIVGLMLLGTIAAISFMFLIEKFVKKEKKEYYGGMYIFFIIGCILTGVVQIAVIQFSIKGAGAFDRLFVNSFHLPLFSGFIFFFILISVLLWFGLRFAKQKGWEHLRLGLYSTAFILMGYSTYFTTMIRSSADPAIDMYNVDNPMSLVGYLARDQYGDFPILYGQKFTASPVADMETGTKYQKIGDRYEAIGKDRKLLYLPKDKMVFPRMWDASNDQNHAYYYSVYSGISQTRDPKTGREGWNDDDGARPSFGDNMSFFAGYQFYWMYLRYFLWNFSGKQNDYQGFFIGNPRDGSWKTGITPIDNMIYGEQSKIPDTTKQNKANNSLFALPAILGLLGMFYHFRRKGGDALINFLLFFFTGIAINIYLNPAGFQPRERDYAYVGSFYAFAVWIGLGVMAIYDFAVKRDNKLVTSILILSGAITVSGFIAGAVTGNKDVGLVALVLSMLFAAVTIGVLYLFSVLHSAIKKPVAIAALSTVLCFVAVPYIMANQEWDDHDRSNKTLAGDLARDYLESCPKNAILFSFGDNDTYPLWYAQEVEGVRPDIRVINYSLLGIDWYINEMRYKVNESDPIDVIFTADQIAGRKRDFIRVQENIKFDATKYYDAYDVMKNYAGSDDKDKVQVTDNESGDFTNLLPTRHLAIPVDRAALTKEGSLNLNTSPLLDSVNIDITKSGLYKNEWAVLNVIAANKWKRPVCFTSNYGLDGIGITKYMRKDGMVYRFVPFSNNQMDPEWMMDKLMNKFKSGNADKAGVFFDEENRRHLLSIRGTYAELAGYLASINRKADAQKVLEKVDKLIPGENIPYGLISRGGMHNKTSISLLDAAYRCDAKNMITKLSTAIKKELEQEIAYCKSLDENRAEQMKEDKKEAEQLLGYLGQMEQMYKNANNPQPTPQAGAKDSGNKPR